MPQLTVTYSRELDGTFDRAALIEELHPLVVRESGTRGVCKTVLRPEETWVGDGPGGRTPLLHVEVGLMPGRSEAVKAHLSESVLALLTRHVPEAAIASVEVRDLAPSYRLFPSTGRGPAREPRRAAATPPATLRTAR
ncbi:5-carboxymethyl-2-hydroxymuconate delta isomerase [Streptomyces sp. XM83C]|jgi:5-carboxymethyl-2-hydroxymuconate isomerase|uniref:5-carboxymethyl-2-hydroxymuconate Delta-isomerase n=1 Tax=unclassified Streptomyces TaxID=2593676 RepID=UPI001FF981AA|nr:5-carboxymethyl-2-hydroxymuconate delta isomerase [Streptomyces sp. XM83C]MCK1822645.1 5-carboxymethyl-2-hydroxymuconate delta isomerase [Streptomyces sp. XM83C]